jgi:uncharacterized membrane protein YeaQ/YmgE (transglycosylase-associated protein family)
MEGHVNTVTCLIVGIIEGWLAERLMHRDHGLFVNLIVGVVGAIIGGFVFSRIMGFQYVEGLNLASILISTVGAIIFLAVVGGIRGIPAR